MDQPHNESETVTLDDSERQPCEVWTRVMGYHRPVSAFNPGKHQEHDDRLHFKERKKIKAFGLGSVDTRIQPQ